MAQSISLGAVGGVRSTDDINFAAASESKRYIVGPMVEAGIPFGFAIEFDALYSREGFRASSASGLGSVSIDSRNNVWTLPVLLKHSFGPPIAKPFAEIGYAPRWMTGVFQSSGTFLSSPSTMEPFSVSQKSNWATSHGLVIGGGVQFHAGRLKLAPELRYTHWNNSAVVLNFSDGPTVQSSQNEIDIAIGIDWKVAGR